MDENGGIFRGNILTSDSVKVQYSRLRFILGLILVELETAEEICPMNPLLERIAINPDICFGKPCIRGTRIWVALILDFLASGMTIGEILTEYPQLMVDDVRAAIAYGAEMTRERYVMLPLPVEA